ncbi:MAG TPA: hypothetical protein DCY61_02580 [Dehalococcoidia bacterium]|nr:hypothetical protein [Dehalococcoidia bacterium]
MMETVMEVKVDEFLAHKIDDIVKRGTFKSKGEFVKSAVEDMIRKRMQKNPIPPGVPYLTREELHERC